MKHTYILAALTIFACSNVEAALSPYYESMREYKALLDSPELTQQLGSGNAIEDIQRSEKGFLIKTTRQALQVDIVYDPVDHPGPQKFHFQFHQADLR